MANVLTWAKDTANYLLYGPGANTSPSRKNTGPLTESAPVRTSYVFDSHIVQEAQQGKNPQTLSAAWDQYGQWGIEQSWQGMTAQDRKNVMLDIFLSTPAVSSCVEVISKRIFSGGFTVEKIDEEGPDNNQHRDQLMEFCLRVNEDWDFCQLGRSLVQDKLIFGESYSEILWKNGLPWNLVKVDCIPMGYKADKYGRIERFYQQMSSTREKNWLDPKDIIRWWFPHPRASIDPFAPVEKVTDAVLLSNKMTRWQIGFFQRGAKFPFYIKGVGDQAEAERYMAFFTENYTGEKNAHKPMITWGTAELAAIGNMGALDMDFGKGLDRQDILIYGGFGVPPAAVSVIKTGALGGDIGEDQDKSLIFNSCDPVKQAWLEKLNYRIVRQGFNITDYRIGLHYADYRSDKDVAEVEDKRIRNGSRTIDEIRVEGGKRPYKIGGDVAVIVTTKEVTPVSRFADLEDESRQNAQVALDTAKANADLAKEKVKQAQKPPEPVPPALTTPNGKKIGKKQAKKAAKQALSPDDENGLNDEKQESIKQLPLLEAECIEEAIPDASHSPVPDNLWVRPDIDQEIARLRDQGVVKVEWGDHPGSCEMCQLNAGHTVALGETFPSGHQLPPAHPNCICPVAFIHEDGSVEIEKDREDPNALQAVNDPDITQSMKAVKVTRTVSSRRE